MKRWIKGIGIACLIPVGLVLLVSILLYIPFVQDYAIKTATGYAAKATGMQFEIGQIRLSFPLHLKIKDATIINKTDTLLNLDYFQVNVSMLPLLKKEVYINGIDLRGVSVNSGDLIDGMILKGRLEKFKTSIDKVDLGKEIVQLDKIDLANTDISLVMRDTTSKEDTTTTSVKWKILVNQINFSNVSYDMRMDHDSLSLYATVKEATLKKGIADIGEMKYGASLFQIQSSTFSYDMNDDEPKPGFDPFHLAFEDINIKVNDFLYSDLNINGKFIDFRGIDRSGLEIVSFRGEVKSDSLTLSVPDLTLQTGHSQLKLMAQVSWSALRKNPKGNIHSILKGEVGKEDILILMGTESKDFKYEFPDKPLELTAGLEGNVDNLTLRELSAVLPGALDLSVTGKAKDLLDNKRRSFEAKLESHTNNLDFLLALLPKEERNRYQLPKMSVEGIASLQNEEYTADFKLLQDKGIIELKAGCNLTKETYNADFTVDSLKPTNFLPLDSLYHLSAAIHAEGKGFDMFNTHTWAKLGGDIKDVQYGTSSLADVKMEGSLEKNELKFNLNSAYPLAKMTMDLSATLNKKKVSAILSADVENLDLYGLHITKDSLITSFQLFAEASSDMKINNQVDITLGNWTLINSASTFHPKTLTLHACSQKDSTHVSFHAGDLALTLTSDKDIETISKTFGKINNEVKLQLKRDSVINIEGLRQYLPDLNFHLSAEKDNPIYNILQQYKTSFARLEVNASTSPDKGLFIDADLTKLLRDTTMIDSICFIVHQDTLGLLYDAHIVKNKYRRQLPFKAQLLGSIRNDFADAKFLYRNDKDVLGMDIGVRVSKENKKDYKIELFPENPIIAFKNYIINPDNYIIYRDIKDISANLRLKGEQDASLWLHSHKEDSTSYNIVQAELSQINLKQISDAFPDIPKIRGVFNADLQYAPSDSNFMVTADAHIDTLFYNNQRVGELMFTTVYLPLSIKQHQVDAHFFRDNEEIMTANAEYKMGESDYLKGNLNILELPLEMANPFIPENMAKMKGNANGEMEISGDVKFPKLDGYLQLDTASVFVTAVGSSVKFDNRRIEVKDNLINFDHYNLYTSGNNPFVINGTVDMHNPSRMTADLTLQANNMELLNVKRNKESMVYGKLLVNVNSTVKGPLESLNMRGNLQLLGGTNLTYVLQDASPTVQDKLAELVTFTDFADTLQTHLNRQNVPLPIGGLNLLMTVLIDQSVKMNVDITQDQSSRVELEGGGDLSFQYTPQGDMFLNGTYTLTGGTVKYAIPIIPLKTFNIQNGSYVQWTGNVMDPTLNLTATESVRASVSDNNGGSRLVTFNVGLSLKQTLENLQMQFILNAPEDQAMQQELDRLGSEQESQIAVTMLVTGMYLNMNDSQGGQKPNFNMGSALNSVLQSEINKIAGSALKSVDITLGMEQYDQNGSEGGGQRTDFSFRFAKRFYNDRISVIIGGKVSTGQDVNNGQAQPFIDNVSIEYRLDGSGTRYIKLFHDVNYDDLLEGEITETGAGIVLRKKMLHLRELFIFKKNKNKPVAEKKKEEVNNEQTK